MLGELVETSYFCLSDANYVIRSRSLLASIILLLLQPEYVQLLQPKYVQVGTLLPFSWCALLALPALSFMSDNRAVLHSTVVRLFRHVFLAFFLEVAIVSCCCVRPRRISIKSGACCGHVQFAIIEAGKGQRWFTVTIATIFQPVSFFLRARSACCINADGPSLLVKC